jgi:hypothetical protein
MTNEILFFVTLPVSFLGILLAFRLFGRAGLYAWTVMAIILANIEVLKIVEVFGFVTALGNVVYGTTFLVTDILTERYGRRAAFLAVQLGFFTLVALTVLLQLTLAFTPHSSDFLSGNLDRIFGFMPRIAVASLAAYLLSQNLDVWLFDRIRRRTGPRLVWLRNNVATMVSQLFDNMVFTWIAFVGPFGLFGWERWLSWGEILSIFLTSYAMKWVVAVCDTPFLYLARRMRAPDIVPSGEPAGAERG